MFGFDLPKKWGVLLYNHKFKTYAIVKIPSNNAIQRKSIPLLLITAPSKLLGAGFRLYLPHQYCDEFALIFSRLQPAPISRVGKVQAVQDVNNQVEDPTRTNQPHPQGSFLFFSGRQLVDDCHFFLLFWHLLLTFLSEHIIGQTILKILALHILGMIVDNFRTFALWLIANCEWTKKRN